jgi:DNA-binding protein HU-beta
LIIKNIGGACMKKADFIEKMAKEAKIAKKAAGKALDTFLDEIKKTLKKGSKVSLIGFGTFHVGKRKARTGRNPKTGAAIKILARKIPKFKAGKAFKDLLK